MRRTFLVAGFFLILVFDKHFARSAPASNQENGYQFLANLDGENGGFNAEDKRARNYYLLIHLYAIILGKTARIPLIFILIIHCFILPSQFLSFKNNQYFLTMTVREFLRMNFLIF